MLSLATKHNDADASLGWGERLGYGSAQFGMNMINGVMGSFLTIYFTNVALLDAAVISSIIAVSKLFDGVSDIIIGRLVDNTKSKLGKGRSWLLKMCIPFAITTLLLFFVPSGLPEMLKYVYVFLLYNLVSTVCFTGMAVPFYSMISLVTRNPYERGMLGNIQQIFQTLGNIAVNTYFVTFLTKFTSDPTAKNIYTQQAFTLTMLVICAIMVATAVLCVFCTKERVTESEDTSQAGKGLPEGQKAPLLVTIKALLTNKYWVIMVFSMFVVFFVIIFSAVGSVYYCQYVFYDMSNY
ncbi:MAG: MFS transporter, partial [Oscillospiraceae bacterium]|nr:MFS transporter [Oscillospiraceae bacterium]